MSTLTMSYPPHLVSSINFGRRSTFTPRDRMSSPLGAFHDPKVSAAYGGSLTLPPAAGLIEGEGVVKGLVGYGRGSTMHSGHMRSGSIAQNGTSSPGGTLQDSKVEVVTCVGSEDRRRLGLTSIRSLAPRGDEMRECLSPSYAGTQDSNPDRTSKVANIHSSQAVKEALTTEVRHNSPPSVCTSTRRSPGIRNLQTTICIGYLDPSQSSIPDEEAQRSLLRVPPGRHQSPRIRRQRSAMELPSGHAESKENSTEASGRSSQVFRRYSSALILPTTRSGTYARSPSPYTRSPSPKGVVKDHMWQTLADSEELDPTIPRLRGEGCAIGQKGKASPGIPWRQLPQFSSTGKLQSTAEPIPAPEDVRAAIGMQSKQETIFSGQKPEIAEVLTHLPETNVFIPPRPASGDGETARDESYSYFNTENSSPFTKPCARSPRVRLLTPVSPLQPGSMVPTDSSPIDDYTFAEKSGKVARKRVQDLRDEVDVQQQPRALSQQRIQVLEPSPSLSKDQSMESTTTTSTASTEHPRATPVIAKSSERPKWR